MSCFVLDSLAQTLTGDKKPSGSKLLDKNCKTFLLVTVESVSDLELSCFGTKHTQSVDTFQCQPNKLTIWLE